MKLQGQTSDFLPVSYQSALQNIRNFLAGRFLGATRDQAFMNELFKYLFAHHWLSQLPPSVDRQDICQSYQAAFARVKQVLPDIFLPSDEIELDETALRYIGQQLAAVNPACCRADIFSEIYEVFAGNTIKAGTGQFFTPTAAVNLLVEMVDPKPGQTICDPACGTGTFLIAAASHLLSSGAKQKEVAAALRGVDKDAYLAGIARGRLALLLDEIPEIICGDSLASITREGQPMDPGIFDVVFANPPFGAKIIAASPETLCRYELARRRTPANHGSNHGHGVFMSDGSMKGTAPVQVLFVEHCLKILRPGGTLGIILPESIVSSKSYAYVVQYLHDRAEFVSVVGMPESLFKTSGKGGTHTKTVAVVLRKKPVLPSPHPVFLAESRWCGHDSRGRPIPLNDIPGIISSFAHFRQTGEVAPGQPGISVPRQRLGLNLAPRAFEFDIEAEIQRLSETHEILSFRDLVQSGVLSISTGDEVGKLSYGTGNIPFVRTSDISNWEIKLDPKHCVSKEIYERYRARQDVRPHDILMVRDGSYLIGTCAIITEYDLPMLYQSHIYKIRVADGTRLTPFLLLAALGSRFVQRQIRSFSVTQDIIDSLGDRIYNLLLPLPKQKASCQRIANLVTGAIQARIRARQLARQALDEIMSVPPSGS